MDVIAMARELGKAIQQDETYLRMALLQQRNDADTELQGMMSDFSLKRMELNTELAKPDKDQERIRQINDDIRSLYSDIMQNPNMIEYNAAKAELDAKMDFVLQILRGSINGEDPDLIERRASGGGCSSGGCGGCSGCG